MTKEKVRNYCSSCDQETWHDIEGKHEYTAFFNPHFDDWLPIDRKTTEHAIVKCKGCETVSFRKTQCDYFPPIDVYHDEIDDYVEVDCSTKVDIFPKSHKGSINTAHLPDIVKNIYQETCNAYRDDSLTLAGIGFRATIEAICNDQHIKGNQLSNRINNLYNKGLLSNKDSDRLHSIRFLGNDAAHDIKQPSETELQAALFITDHLITTVYIVDKEANKLEGIIHEYEQFKKLLVKNIKNYQSGDEFPLHKYLGKEARLLNGSSTNFNKKLNEQIGTKQFKLLAFGKKEEDPKSKEKIQYYIVM